MELWDYSLRFPLALLLPSDSLHENKIQFPFSVFILLFFLVCVCLCVGGDYYRGGFTMKLKPFVYPHLHWPLPRPHNNFVFVVFFLKNPQYPKLPAQLCGSASVKKTCCRLVTAMWLWGYVRFPDDCDPSSQTHFPSPHHQHGGRAMDREDMRHMPVGI